MSASLASFPLFAGLAAPVRETLEGATDWRRCPKGEYLFREGDPAKALLLVAEGQVKVFKEFPNGKNVIMGLFGPGSVVAEVAVVDRRPYPASAVAHIDTMAGLMPAERFLAAIHDHPDLAMALLKGMSAKLRELTGNMGAMAVHPVAGRVARMLLKLADRIGESRDGVRVVELPMTRRDLAEIVGTAFEVVERALKKMREEGLIAVEGRVITLLDEEGLAAMLD